MDERQRQHAIDVLIDETRKSESFFVGIATKIELLLKDNDEEAMVDKSKYQGAKQQLKSILPKLKDEIKEARAIVDWLKDM